LNEKKHTESEKTKCKKKKIMREGVSRGAKHKKPRARTTRAKKKTVKGTRRLLRKKKRKKKMRRTQGERKFLPVFRVWGEKKRETTRKRLVDMGTLGVTGVHGVAQKSSEPKEVCRVLSGKKTKKE